MSNAEPPGGLTLAWCIHGVSVCRSENLLGHNRTECQHSCGEACRRPVTKAASWPPSSTTIYFWSIRLTQAAADRDGKAELAGMARPSWRGGRCGPRKDDVALRAPLPLPQRRQGRSGMGRRWWAETIAHVRQLCQILPYHGRCLSRGNNEEARGDGRRKVSQEKTRQLLLPNRFGQPPARSWIMQGS